MHRAEPVPPASARFGALKREPERRGVDAWPDDRRQLDPDAISTIRAVGIYQSARPEGNDVELDSPFGHPGAGAFPASWGIVGWQSAKSSHGAVVAPRRRYFSPGRT